MKFQKEKRKKIKKHHIRKGKPKTVQIGGSYGMHKLNQRKRKRNSIKKLRKKKR